MLRVNWAAESQRARDDQGAIWALGGASLRRMVID